ncbi:MAG: hypothetical protein H5T74_11750 [Actinobacteria bacterium]|nr:hypothetical protein [Actinomycetota bacterium]
MKEIWRKTISLMVIMALALFIAVPFIPAAASGEEDVSRIVADDAEGEAVSLEEEAPTQETQDEQAQAETATGSEADLGEEGAAETVKDTSGHEAEAQNAASEADRVQAITSGGDRNDTWEVTSLDIRKGVDVVRAPGWDISLEKTASESYLAMEVGEKRDITFTINVGASAGNAYHIEGDIFVKNTGEWPADVIAVSDTVWYKAGGPDWLPASSSITTTVPMGDNAIPTGGPHVYSYSGTFTIPVPLSSVTAMSNLIEITISNKPAPPKPGMQDWTFHYRESFPKPQTGAPGTVSLEDIETVDPDAGLSYTIKSTSVNGSPASSLAGPWSLDLAQAPFTVVIEKELAAEAAGTYVLNNKARIGDLEDDVDVTIEVKEKEVRLGAITGTKYVDLDADGELDEGEPALEGVTIRLFRSVIPAETATWAALLSGEATALAGETVTDENGDFAFNDLHEGLYVVEEEVPEGYFPTSQNPVEIWVAVGQEAWVYFLNARMARVTAEKLDYTTQLPIAGVKFVLEGDEFRAEAISAGDGSLDFGWLMPGAYTLYEEVPAGWAAVTEAEVELELASGDRFHQVFVNRRLGSIYGYKWLDVNGDGIHQDDEPGVEGVRITLQGEGLSEEMSTDAEGRYAFEDLLDGQYLVREEVPAGHYATGVVEVGFVLQAGEERRVDFINAPYAAVTGYKWLDTNANGQFDEGEKGLEGVTIRLLDDGGGVLATLTSASDGSYAFRELRAGAYRVEEVMPEGYVATSPVAVSFSLLPGEEKRVDFHNNVLVAGEVVTPPAQPQQPEQEAQQQGTLPRTGFDVLYFLLIFGALMLAGFIVASVGAARLARMR